jgi:hypothetical protein
MSAPAHSIALPRRFGTGSLRSAQVRLRAEARCLSRRHGGADLADGREVCGQTGWAGCRQLGSDHRKRAAGSRNP